MRTWPDVHADLRARPAEFGRIAAARYPGLPRAAGTSLLTRPEWTPAGPVPLEAVRLEWEPDPAPPAVADPPDGLPDGHRTYAEARAALDRPAVFEDRPAYRLLAADLRAGGGVLRFGPGRYFDAVNVGQSAAHELAAGGRAVRDRVGDPRDLARRPAVLAISTLAVTASGRCALHWRDPAKVAHAGGLWQVVPVGVFQPPSPLDLWSNLVREAGEELLGNPEGEDPVLHAAMTRARDAGRVRVWCLGLGVDPLTFATDLLTVAVFDDAAFAELFGDLAATGAAANDEGTVRLVPLGGAAPGPMQPAGAAVLALARRHRRPLGITPG
ncbi:hypothetical protein [Actinomadura parmotrematis]|uniref:Transcriptional regulator n=1 Tax=Actinomadura parmotrematis TaxID=2864039 RepID=A0ABS7G1R3_9ACTN|nr:hypothetical protein [Actinomadura parmotrematis]MBW8486652.1 hypothetical protein [Actinomadura parmotrematis]